MHAVTIGFSNKQISLPLIAPVNSRSWKNTLSLSNDPDCGFSKHYGKDRVIKLGLCAATKTPCSGIHCTIFYVSKQCD